MAQYGGGRMGGVALAAGGTVVQNFLNMPVGPVEALILTISVALKSSAAAFAAVVSTSGSASAEGIDDMDLILNALFTLLTMNVDPSTPVGTLTPAQWRTILGLLNQRDIYSTFTNGVSVPISSGSATTFKFMVRLPISLQQYFVDGGIFRNGSQRMKAGDIQYTMASSLTPTVVCANGSAVVQAGMSVAIEPEFGAGSEADIGMTWNVKRLSSLPTSYDLGEGMRLAILDTTAVASSAVSSFQVGNYNLWQPSSFGAKYAAERLAAGGYDITARCTPLVWIEPNRKFMEFLAMLGAANKIDAVSGVSSLTVYDVRAIGAAPDQVARVATQVGGGGPTTQAAPTPASLPPGTAIPAALQGFLPTRILPGSIGSGSQLRAAATPNQAAEQVVRRDLQTKKASGFLAMFGKR